MPTAASAFFGLMFAGIVASAALPAAAPVHAATPPPADTAPDRQGISQTFERVRTALLEGDGSAALPLLSTESRERLEAVHLAARSSAPEALAVLTPAEKFAAIGLGRYLTLDDLATMSLDDIADFALAERWLGPDLIAASTLGAIDVTGDRAVAALLIDQRPQLVPADFVREDGGWRIDLTRALTLSDELLRMAALTGRTTEEAMIRDLLDRLGAGR